MLSTKKRITSLIPVGLVSAVAVAMAVVPAVASATEVTPANTTFTGTLAPLPNPAKQVLSVFVEKNSFELNSVACKKSTITGTTPTAIAGQLFNQNKPEVGTDSLGYGSVITNIEVSFSECGIYEWATAAKEWKSVGIPVTVTTTKKSEGKGWSLVAYQDKLREEAKSPPYTAAGVPPSGATITVVTEKITISPDVASSVFGEWTNGTSTKASTDRVDGQIEFEGSGVSPAQFEAAYTITGPKGEGIIVKA